MTQASSRPLAVVTGASSGIGYELAKQFAEHGFDPIVNAEDPGIHEAASHLGSTGADVRAVQADLSTYDGCAQFATTVQETRRPVDALALNAGVGVGGEFIRTELADELRLLRLNVEAAVHLAKRFLPGMVARGEGRVLFTSSIAATMPGPYISVYAASKSFLQSFSEAVRNEIEDSGVTVTSLMPGPTDTEFFDRAGMQDTPVAQGTKDDPAEVARAGFEALMAGKDKVVAGSLKNKVMAASSKVLSEQARASIHGKMSEPGQPG